MKQYYIYKPDRTQEGPYPEEMVRTSYEQGMLPANTLIWFDGASEWMPIQNIFSELRAASSTTSASDTDVSADEPNIAAVSATLIEDSAAIHTPPAGSAMPTPQPATPVAPPDVETTPYPKSWNPITAFVSCMKRYARFSGRASRSEYFFFQLAWFMLFFLFFILGAGGSVVGFLLSGLLYYGSIVPGLAVTARRFHDTGRSGWLMLIPIYACVIVFLPSKNDNNPYGTAPLPPV